MVETFSVIIFQIYAMPLKIDLSFEGQDKRLTSVEGKPKDPFSIASTLLRRQSWATFYPISCTGNTPHSKMAAILVFFSLIANISPFGLVQG